MKILTEMLVWSAMKEIESIFIVIVSPLFIAGAGMWLIRFLNKDHHKKSPVTKKVARYPGYSLMQRIEGLNERLDFYLLALIIIPAITLALVGMGYFHNSSRGGGVIMQGTYLGALAVIIWKLIRTSSRLIRARRGLRGELIVGNELGRLWQSGYQIFHDFPLNNANIDHVVVGPGGVFAIETKYRRKLKGRTDGHVARLKGDTLHFPTGSSSSPVKQAYRQAAELATILEKMFGATVVTPVLIFPGWLIEEEGGDSGLLIGSAKRVIKAIRRSPNRLDLERVSQISAFIRERCSDVEV